MTGTADHFMRYTIAGGGGHGEVSEDELWWPPAKVSGRYIAPWLATRGLAPTHHEPPPGGIDVELPLTARGMPKPRYELDSLGPTGR